MSEIRDGVKEAIARIVRNGRQLEEQGYDVWTYAQSINQTADEILSIPELAIVDRKAQLDFDSFTDLLAGYDIETRKQYKDAFEGFGKLLKDWLLRAYWVKEVRE